jgi:glucans biosynthesis protein C
MPVVKERENYVDNIRVYLTALVILHHAAVTYGAPGGWYYKEEADGLVSGLLLTVFVSTNQAFFMGLFFFLSSYFIPQSYERKGPANFMTDRIKRLGIPLIFYSLVISPVTIYMLITMGYNKQVSFLDYYFHRENWIETGVLWFTAALLLFTAFFWLTKSLSHNKEPLISRAPSNRSIFLFAIALGIVSFMVRIGFPIGWTLPPLGFQFAHFPQYIALFAIGMIAFNNKWLSTLSWQQGRKWLWLAVALVIIGFPCIYLLKIITDSELDAFLGGLTIQSFVNSVWEQVLGISIIMAVLSIGKYNWNSQSAFMKELARSAYAVYIIHPMVLVFIALLLKDIHLASLLKFLITGVLSVGISFALGFVLVRIPLVNKVV